MKVFRTGVKIVRGEVHVLMERCKGCGFCIEYCPNEVLERSDEFNIKGYHYPVIKAPEKCINCGLCEMLCPDFAIWSTLKEKKEVTEM
jgi:2-oxoglutarate ferredoxin oxidoreductase subunit delta